MNFLAEPLEETTTPEPAALLGDGPPRVEVAVHDATRLAWNVTAPLPDAGRASCAFAIEVEIPANVFGMMDPWAALQAHARLDGLAALDAQRGPEGFRMYVLGVTSRLARARDGFARHCTLIRTAPIPDNGNFRALEQWIAAASAEVERARNSLLGTGPTEEERCSADEFVSFRLWAALTDCGRALLEARQWLPHETEGDAEQLDAIEAILARALKHELDYRRQAGFTLPECANASDTERIFTRMRALKKRFERVTYLEAESYEVLSRFSGWFSSAAAMLGYLWFIALQFALGRRPATVGSGVVLLALVTAAAYASRERLKEAGRNWLAGRVQRLFAQRVTRYRLPSRGGKRGAVAVSAHESFSQSSALRPDPVYPDLGARHDVTLLRFVHRGYLMAADKAPGEVVASKVRFIYRLDLSSLFPRLHDAARGLALPDEHPGRIAIVDVPRNYEISVRAYLSSEAGNDENTWTLVLNKNGLVRIDERAPNESDRATGADVGLERRTFERRITTIARSRRDLARPG